MLDTLGIVQLHVPQRSQGGRWQSGSGMLFRQLAGRSVLERIVRRATEAQRLDGVIALTDDSAAYDEIVAAIPPDVPVFLSQAADPLAQAVEAIERFPCLSAVFLSMDTPFVDPALIDRLLITAHAYPECDYIGYRQRDGRPSIMSDVGVFAEWCTTQALKIANRKAVSPADRATPTHFLYSHPERFQLRLLAAPQELDRDDLRLRVACEEDWDHVDMIADALGEDALEWQCVARLLDNQPALRQQMAQLNKRMETVDN